MKVAIIGRGTSALVTAMIILRRGHQVDCFYDPDRPHLRVGESTTPHISSLLRDVLGMCIGTMVDDKIASYKNGVHFINWGVGGEFTHPFNSNHTAFHLDSGRFNPYVADLLTKKRGVEFIAEKYNGYEVINNRSISINGREYDFVVNCSGWQEDKEYDEPLFETVNSAILYTEPGTYQFHHTLHRATEDGWQFGIPFPELGENGETHCGYMYNTKFSSDDSVKAKFEGREYKHISWKPRYAKKMINNQFEAFNGNRLFFMEPLQALSLDYYKLLAEKIVNFIESRTIESFSQVNKEYRVEMIDYQYALALHYQFGSIHKTPFWEDVTRRARTNLKFHPAACDDELFYEYMLCDTETSDNLSVPYQWKEQIRPDSPRPNVGNTITDHCRIAGFNYFDTKTLYCGFNQIRFHDFEEKYSGLPRN